MDDNIINLSYRAFLNKIKGFKISIIYEVFKYVDTLPKKMQKRFCFGLSGGVFLYGRDYLIMDSLILEIDNPFINLFYKKSQSSNYTKAYTVYMCGDNNYIEIIQHHIQLNVYKDDYIDNFKIDYTVGRYTIYEPLMHRRIKYENTMYIFLHIIKNRVIIAGILPREMIEYIYKFI